MTDMTPDYQANEQEQLKQLKDDFLSSISHELRSPLTNIKMATQMLKVLFQQDDERGVMMSNRLEPEAWSASTNSRQLSLAHKALGESSLASLKTRMMHYIKILECECDRETRLLNNLLDLQQLDAGVYGFSTAVIYLQDSLPNVIQPFLEYIAQQQQCLEVHGIENLPAITTEPLSLERLLSELLNNACKFTPPGGKILIAAELQPPENEGVQMLQLTVTNTKVEISDREIPQIFERFYRIPHSDRWKHSGTGLGLALVKKLVEHLGGSIAVESGCGQTCFTLTIPTVALV
ncbi:MAG: HAMP domain-containing histidine kinase [Tildeniella nuda ZEHNDER 1965/U140]|nr:HAMP domain-containing histidine kinase [Tildeniella nuda ZEHNDER 1965/U140]